MTPRAISDKYHKLREAVTKAEEEFEQFAASAYMASVGHASIWCPRKVGDIAEFDGRKMVIERIGLSPGLLGAVRWVYRGRNIRKDGSPGLVRTSETEPLIPKGKA